MIDALTAVVNACNTKIPQLDAVANNIANIHTPGFKSERLYFRVESTGGNAGAVQKDVSYTPSVIIDFSTGTLQRTGNPLDVAIQGDGFFVVRTKDGEAYTRKGNFTVNGKRELVTPEGDLVMGESGSIVLPGQDIRIGEKGDISSGGAQIGRLKIVKADRQDQLIKSGAGLFVDPEKKAGIKQYTEAEVRAGHLENSNVQALKEMVDMINIQRSVESYQKVILTLGDQDKSSTGRIGKL